LGCSKPPYTSAPRGPHVAGRELVLEADHPPPPAISENVVPPEDPRCVWVDGHWNLRGRGWEWLRGGFVRPPRGCYYARPELFWVPVPSAPDHPGKLLYRVPKWYPDPNQPNPPTECESPTPC
jgi:hypothetical protein